MSTPGRDVGLIASRELASRLHVTHRPVLSWAREGYSLSAILAALRESEGVQEPQWLSIATVAARFDVDEKTIRRWISAGHVHARRFGPRIIRVSLLTVLDYSEQIGGAAPDLYP